MDKDVVVYICHNSIPEGVHVPRQWDQDNLHIVVKEMPCTGKITTQYLFHAFEEGIEGIVIIACPQGKCTLNQGNYRAQIRVQNVKRLLQEIGIEPGRIELLHYCDHNEHSLITMMKGAISQLSRRGTRIGADSSS